MELDTAHDINMKFASLNVALFLLIAASEAFTVKHSVRKNLFWIQSSTSPFDLYSSPTQEVTCDALGGTLKRIKLENEEDGFLTKHAVPAYATFPSSFSNTSKDTNNIQSIRKGLEALVPGAFVVENALSTQECEEIISACETSGFGKFNAGKNNHSAMQILVTHKAADTIGQEIFQHVDMNVVNTMAKSFPGSSNNNVEYEVVGLNRRWRIYRYDQGGQEKFAPHIDAGFPPSSLSKDGSTLIWDASEENTSSDLQYDEDTVSRLTVLMYLNDDFAGGHTKFYTPVAQVDAEYIAEDQVLASVKPKQGSILLFPQAVGEDAVNYAREYWPLHEGSPVPHGNRPKYVIRSDVLFTKAREGISDEEKLDPLWKNDEYVRDTFMPKSPIFSPTFMNHVQSLYNPAMGVENAGALLYSLVRFNKVRTIVEIGAGYTTLFLLQALKDNDDEMKNISELTQQGKNTMLNIQWTPEGVLEDYHSKKSSLLCIDNCLHQKETASGAGAVAKTLGLSDYLEFIKGDAYDMQFEPESIDMLWCDFGVGSRMKDFAKGAWKAIRPGGFLVCHSTLTNQGTRDWLEAVRNRGPEEQTGLPQGEFTEISFLEPQKRYQNSISILQRRKGASGEYHEPIFSQYA